MTLRRFLTLPWYWFMYCVLKREPPPLEKRLGRPPDVMAAREGSPAIDLGELDKATAKAWDAIVAANSHTDGAEFLFRYGDQPSRLEHTDAGQLVPRPLTADRMRHRLTEIVWWQKKGQGGRYYTMAAAPTDLVRNVLAAPDPPLPVLSRIVEVPVLGPDGSIHDKPGYSEKHRVFYEPRPDLVVPQLTRRRPARDDVRRAVELILTELLGDFPFVSDAERAHALCLVLQPFVRDLIAGPTPLYLIEAPTPGTGKGLLAQAAGWAAIGGPVPAMTEGRDEDEWRKRITAVLRKSPVAVLIDNLREPLDAAALSSVLTSDVWEDRRLGHSETLTLPNRATWIATGNNPQLSGEIARRTVRIRVDSEMEHPEDRQGFRHADLLGWARERRGDLVWAALTLGRTWVMARRPKPDRSLGSFESWAHVMGGILLVADVPGFLGNLEDLRENAGTEHDDMAAFLDEWLAVYKNGQAVRTRDIAPHLFHLINLDPDKQDATHKAGKFLAKHVDRRYGNGVLRRGPNRGGGATWVVDRFGSGGG
jgi:putative DNA primase/helicase